MTTESPFPPMPKPQGWQILPIANGPDTYNWYARMREENPVFFDTQREAWLVFRYHDVQQMLRTPEAFSSQRHLVMIGAAPAGPPEAAGSFPAPPEMPMSDPLITLDPPRHRQLRTLVSQAFTPRSVSLLESRCVAIVQELLDKVKKQGTMDVIHDVAFPLPAIVIAELVGVPAQDRTQFYAWSSDIMGTSMERFFIAKQHRQMPQNDLISDLLIAEVDGERLSDHDIVAFCAQLISAGHDTTMNLIGNAFLCFDEHPEVMQELREQPALLPSAIEEVLRYYAPVQTMARVMKTDTMVAGQEIKAGQVVLPLFSSANRDEAQFSHADVFDIRRSPNQHVAFGYGIHFCLGAPLARMEGRIVLQAMLEQLPDIRRASSEPLAYRHSSILYGVERFPILFG